MNAKTARSLAWEVVADAVEDILADDLPIWLIDSSKRKITFKEVRKIEKEIEKISESIIKRAIRNGSQEASSLFV